MILPDQFFLRILTDGAKLFVHVGDSALDIGYRDDGVLIQSELLICQSLERLLPCRQALFDGFQRRRALGDALFQFGVQSVDLGSRSCADADLAVDCKFGQAPQTYSDESPQDSDNSSQAPTCVV